MSPGWGGGGQDGVWRRESEKRFVVGWKAKHD